MIDHTGTDRGPPAVPRATYRLQFNKDFRFEDARRLVPYLASLGISHVYASPLMMARAGSTHGYDIVDHGRLNPEIGDQREFDALVADLHRHDMGLILDFVPNHMGIGPDNPWWVDVLEWGESSPRATYFDIDWQPPESSLAGKVLLPVLGDHYGLVLERGELQIRFDSERGTFAVWYFDNSFPVGPKDYPWILQRAATESADSAPKLRPLVEDFRECLRLGRGKAQKTARREGVSALKGRLAREAATSREAQKAISDALAVLNGNPDDPGSFDLLHGLLERQAYRLAFWRVAAHEINYRRFFDINDLAGLRMEQPELFDASHRLIRDMILEGKIQGLRLDHVDGMRDPKQYFERLQSLADPQHAGTASRQVSSSEPERGHRAPFYVLVEKILAPHETLRADWPVSGTTGYEFMNQVGGLFVDPAAERGLTRCYERFIGRRLDFEEMVIEAKRLIMRETLASELNVLANALNRLAKRNRNTRDYSLIALRAALVEVVANFPVYRSYVTNSGLSPEDRRDIDWAIGRAQKTARTPDSSIYGFLREVLTLDLPSRARSSYRRREVLDVASKCQQYTGPVMAKAMEDTSFYRYFRLVSLNEVGGEPTRFGIEPNAFHGANERRLQDHPHCMIATATHDHKRGEDMRARLHVLSEVHRDWAKHVHRWARLNRRKKRSSDLGPAPSSNDEYLLYQTIVGAWPLDLSGPEYLGIDAFCERIGHYMLKAVREAKARTSWAAPAEDYESALTQFVERVLDPTQSGPFLNELHQFVNDIAPAGAVNGLAQTLLKLTCPGVPDVYQGTELWDFSLVDPDNRRPVDYEFRSARLHDFNEPSVADQRIRSWRDGRVKAFVIERALAARRRDPDLFAAGAYRPLEIAGAMANRIVCFARTMGHRSVIVVVPRLVSPMLNGEDLPLPRGWSDTRVRVPQALLRGHILVDALTGDEISPPPDGQLQVGSLLQGFPVSLIQIDQSR